MKFKKGDKLKLIDTRNMRAEKGALAEVIRPHTMNPNLIIVKWLDEKSNGQSDGSYYEGTFGSAIDEREQAIYMRMAKVKRPKPRMFKKGDKVRVVRIIDEITNHCQRKVGDVFIVSDKVEMVDEEHSREFDIDCYVYDESHRGINNRYLELVEEGKVEEVEIIRMDTEWLTPPTYRVVAEN